MSKGSGIKIKRSEKLLLLTSVCWHVVTFVHSDIVVMLLHEKHFAPFAETKRS